MLSNVTLKWGWISAVHLMTDILQIQKNTVPLPQNPSPFFLPTVHPEPDLAISYGENCFSETDSLWNHWCNTFWYQVESVGDITACKWYHQEPRHEGWTGLCDGASLRARGWGWGRSRSWGGEAISKWMSLPGREELNKDWVTEGKRPLCWLVQDKRTTCVHDA